MNRNQRRTHREKLTHSLTKQTCVLWVPEEKGYLADFSPRQFRVMDNPALARHYTEDEAASAALSFREVTGMRAAVRPYYPQNTVH